NYINNTGDGTSWLEQLSATLKTFKVPLQFNGSTSGSAQIGVAATAGSPSKINLPTSTSGAGGLLQSDGATPQQTPWIPVAPATLTDAATITWAIGSFTLANATVTLGGNRTLNITNPISGGTYILRILQDGTGGRTLALGTGCTWKVANGGAGAITLTAAANA